MPAHQITIRLDEGGLITECVACPFAAGFDSGPNGFDPGIADSAMRFAEKLHLVESDAMDIGAVRIAGAFLTRRRWSFVGRLDDERTVIIGHDGAGAFRALFNGGELIGADYPNVAAAVQAVQESTGREWK